VLIGYEGEVKLIDFGIAKAAGKASKTQAGILKGKFGYMSPEQVRGLPIDRRSDIFSVGIVMYELLTNERLFVGESDFSTLEKVRNVEIMPPSSYNKKIPSELERIVLKVLAKDPEDRYQNAIDLHDDLQSFLHKIGEFYSRKDLAAWMKKMFAVEIEEDSAKLEQYRQLVAPGGAVESSVRRVAAGGAPVAAAARGGAPSAKAAPSGNAKAAPPAGKESKMDWDDEELDTQIFDKDEEVEIVSADKAVAADDLFYEDDDRTVANEPPPDILEQARQPGSQAPGPRLARAPRPTPVAIPLPAPRAAASPKSTLMGMPSPGLPPPARQPGSGPNPAGPPQGLAGLRRSGLNMPTPVLPPPSAPATFSFDAPQRGGFGTGAFTSAPPARGSRAGTYLLLMLVAAGVIGGTLYWYTNVNKPGRLQLVTVPADATVLIDNAKVGDHSPLALDKPAGSYTLSVVKDGYVRDDQNITIAAGQPLARNVTLQPSPDTGFELSSEPSGGLVWLDGAPIPGPNGQARTDFRALRIAPGHHVLEIKGENRYRPWKEDIEVEPGSIRKIRATLVPSGEAGGRASAHNEPSRAEPSRPEPSRAEPSRPEPSNAQATAPNPTTATPAATRVAGLGPKKKKPRVDPGAGADDTAAAPPKTDAAGGNDCTITIGSRPWAEVWIDGKNTNKHTPFADYKIACGKHKIAFKRADLSIDKTESITVSPGEKFKQSFTLVNDDE
jgi:hypothetical protein